MTNDFWWKLIIYPVSEQFFHEDRWLLSDKHFPHIKVEGWNPHLNFRSFCSFLRLSISERRASRSWSFIEKTLLHKSKCRTHVILDLAKFFLIAAPCQHVEVGMNGDYSAVPYAAYLSRQGRDRQSGGDTDVRWSAVQRNGQGSSVRHPLIVLMNHAILLLRSSTISVRNIISSISMANPCIRRRKER